LSHHQLKQTTRPYASRPHHFHAPLAFAKLIVFQVFVWPGVTQESLTAKPFHIYDDEFYDVIGRNPSLTLIASSDSDPIFHEAVTW
jgi:hypothetical protein